MDTLDHLISSVGEKLFSESTVAKVWGTALLNLNDPKPPVRMPEYSYGRYIYRDIDYWTAGFFPGAVYALLERAKKYPSKFPLDKINLVKLEYAARWWAEGLTTQITRTDNHDLGFMIQPAFQREYEYSDSAKAKNCLVTAANALATRWDENVGCIRSWDVAINKRYSFDNMDRDFIVIIDNMCNLDLLYYAAHLTGDLRLSTIATKHAETTMKNHFRHPEWSSFHMLNYNKKNGTVKGFTNQGYADESTWSRGQAWGILGYAETYHWTKQQKFLDVSKNLGEYYLSRLPEDGVPPWDFDAPNGEIKDVSSAMVAALGFLKIYKETKEKDYLHKCLKLVNDSVNFAYSDEATLKSDGSVEIGEFDTILKHSTTINNPDALTKYFDHGLVYADYYFLVIGNTLLELGLYD